jgi:hypothetical protein
MHRRRRLDTFLTGIFDTSLLLFLALLFYFLCHWFWIASVKSTTSIVAMPGCITRIEKDRPHGLMVGGLRLHNFLDTFFNVVSCYGCEEPEKDVITTERSLLLSWQSCHGASSTPNVYLFLDWIPAGL